jgi:ERCC4-type nuclease
MLIKIDNREDELIKLCRHYLEISPLYKGIDIEVHTLPIGDIIISENGDDKVLIERKSLRDLSASIKDGRYEEQSYRLNGSDTNNHNIIYLIEGDMNRLNFFKDRIDRTTLYSAMFSLSYYKGFSVMRSIDIDETAIMICNMANKLRKTADKDPYYKKKSVPEKTAIDLSEETDQDKNNNLDDGKEYCSVVKKVKKENITPDNIGEIMLCQIPGISSTTALAIMAQFKNMPVLINSIKENPNCLKDISYTNAKGKTRKINKTASANIVKFLS